MVKKTHQSVHQPVGWSDWLALNTEKRQRTEFVTGSHSLQVGYGNQQPASASHDDEKPDH